jgi:hypothetical protein
MKKRSTRVREHEMHAEYDFSNAVRGKYAKRFAEESNIIVLDPDVAKVFKNSKSVNQALRALSEIIRQQQKRKKKVSD